MGRDPAITHKIMSSVKSKNTRPEIALRKALWRQGLRFRVNFRELPGKPDVVFTRVKVAVFCDGDYWHGHNWALRGLKNLNEELARYSEFWARKIYNNVQHDRMIDCQLKKMGWHVVRVWESDIKKDLSECVRQIYMTYLTYLTEKQNDIILKMEITSKNDSSGS